MVSLVKAVVDPNERELIRLRRRVAAINALEPGVRCLSDEALAAKTEELRRRLAAGETLDDILHEAFAVVREVARRALGERHFDVQLMGGIALHEGKIAEMKTGEGKTLTSTLPIYLNALTGEGVHLVTVNDYLAKRDAAWMGPIYQMLGLSVGVIQHDLDSEQRRIAYTADITYGTNSEMGFDYLRDNMANYQEQTVQRKLHYAIVDEVDNILVDEARVPLIISGYAAKPTDLYHRIDRVVASLQSERDYKLEEKARTAVLTEDGVARVEKALSLENLADPENLEISHHVNAALRARCVYKRDVDYVVKDGEVIIVDEFTGRLQPGRRFSEGLHQALEAKEGVRVQEESQTIATISYQNFFRLYEKLAGMTGTAKTEEGEFIKIYNMPVVVIPTNLPMIRDDQPDIVYKTEEAKFRGAVWDILITHARRQPALVGTRSIEVSERLSARLAPDYLQKLVMALLLREAMRSSRNLPPDKRREYSALVMGDISELPRARLRGVARDLGVDVDPLSEENIRLLLKSEGQDEQLAPAVVEDLTNGIPHNVLNAKYHEQEAQIIAQAGRLGAVTIATNMAGRGVDIILGGSRDGREPEEWQKEHQGVVRLGGLLILGSERHEARRIDNQLRGRSGRQGDPGVSRFYLSLEDELMRLFGSDRLGFMFKGWPEDEPLASRLLSRSIESAQKKVEGHHFDMRKNLLKYDNVMNTQRCLIYDERRKVLVGEDFRDTYLDMADKLVRAYLAQYANKELHREDWDLEKLYAALGHVVPDLATRVPYGELASVRTHQELEDTLAQAVQQAYLEREKELGGDLMRALERYILLSVINSRWMAHLEAMDSLREGVGFQAYGQMDPLVAYQKEAHAMFEHLLAGIREDALWSIFRYQVVREPRRVAYRSLQMGTEEGGDGRAAQRRARTQEGRKVGRNDPCPCGSGKKYKRCCMLKEGA